MTEKAPGTNDPAKQDDQRVPMDNDPTKIMAGDDDSPDDDTQPFVSVAVSLVGQTLSDRYAVEGELGRGGMGVVYRGRNRSIDRPVAIKVLDVNLLNSNTSKKRFEQEAKASANLEHPNLVSVFDYGFGPYGEPYIVMELLNGVSLDKVLKKQGPFSIERFSHVFKQICKALGHVHKRGLIHRDIKPGNIMLISTEDDPDFVKLVDFGIAKVVPQDGRTIQRLTATGQSFGSPLYMSPEQCMGQEVDARSDVYSLGCVMYEMLTGIPPIQGENPLQTLFAHVNSAPMPIADTGTASNVPPKFEAILMKMLEKKPGDRFQSIAEVSEELTLVTGGASGKSEQSREKKSATDSDTMKKVVPAPDEDTTSDTSVDTGGDIDKKSARVAEKDKKGATSPNTKLRIPLAIAGVVALLAIATPIFKPSIDKNYEESYQRQIAPAKNLFDRGLYGNAVAEYGALKPDVEKNFGDESKQIADLLYRTAQANRKNNSDPAGSKSDLIRAQDILEDVYEENADSEPLVGFVHYELGRAYEASLEFSKAVKEYEGAIKILDRPSADQALMSEIKAHLGISLVETKEPDKAEPLLSESLKSQREQQTPDHDLLSQTAVALSKVYAGRREFEKARSVISQIKSLIEKSPTASRLNENLEKQFKDVESAQTAAVNLSNFSSSSSSATERLLKGTQIAKPWEATFKLGPDGLVSPFGTVNQKGIQSPLGTIGENGFTLNIPAENTSGSKAKLMVESAKPLSQGIPLPSDRTLQPGSKIFQPSQSTFLTQPQNSSASSPFLQRPAGAAIRSQFQHRVKMRLSGETEGGTLLDNLRRSAPPFPPLPTAK